MEPWLVVGVAASVVISLYTGFRLFTLLDRINRESRRSFDIATRLQEDWERFAAAEKKSQERFAEEFDRFETDMRDRVDRFQKMASGTRERLIKLEEYLKEFFEVELKAVFDSFDRTVASILDEMKSELLRGVGRIEDIQAVVDSKSFAKDRILDGEGSVYRLIADADEETGAGEDEEYHAGSEEPVVGTQEGNAGGSSVRLQADEAES